MVTFDDYKKYVEESKKKDSSLSSYTGNFREDYTNFIKGIQTQKPDKIDYNSLSKNSDFGQYSTAKLSTPLGDIYAGKVNITGQKGILNEVIEGVNRVNGVLGVSNELPFEYMDDNERAIYTYLHENPNYGKKYADDYIESIKQTLNTRMTDEYTKTFNAFADKHPVLGSGLSAILNLAGGGIAAIGDVQGAVGNVLDKITGIDVTPEYSAYNSNHLLNNVSDSMTQTVSDKIENPVGKFLYGAGKSTLDSGVNVLAYGAAATIPMAMNAYASKMRELEDAGASKAQMAIGSVLSGAIEYATEKFSIDNLLKDKGIKNLQTFLKETGKQMLTEGSEEVASDVLNDVVDVAFGALGGYSELKNKAQQYELNGESKTDAVWHVVGDAVVDAIKSGAAGAISGGIMGGLSNAGQYRTNARVGSNISSMGNVESLAEQAKKYGRDDLVKELENNPSKAAIGMVQTELLKEAAQENEKTQNNKRATEEEKKQAQEKYDNVREDVLKNQTRINNIEQYAESLPRNQRDVFLQNYIPDTDVDQYASAFDYAYSLGRKGFTKEAYQLQQDNILTADQVKNIFEAGFSDRNSVSSKLNDLQDRINKRRELFPDRKIRGQINDDVISYDGSDPNKTDYTKLTDNQKKNIDLAKALAKAFNVNVKFYDSTKETGEYKTKNGSYNHGTNTIMLDIMATNTGTTDTTNAITTTMSHELTHWAKQNSPELYKKFRLMMLETLSNNFNEAVKDKVGEVRTSTYIQWEKNRNESYKNLTDEQVEDELIARACENMLSNSEYMSKALAKMTAEEQKTFGEKIVEFFKKIRDAIKEVMGQYNSNSSQYRLLARDLEAMNELQEKWDEMIEDASKASAEYNAEIESKDSTEEVKEAASETNSLKEIIGEKGSYGLGVYLDTELFKNIKPRNWGDRLRKHILDEFDNDSFVAYDNGVPQEIFVQPKKWVKKNTAKGEHQIIDEYMRKKESIIDMLVLAHIDETIKASRFLDENNDNSHGNFDANGWDFRTVIVEDIKGKIWQATLNIAKDNKDVKSLYFFNHIHKIDEALARNVSSTDSGRDNLSSKASDEKISSETDSVKTDFSEKEHSFTVNGTEVVVNPTDEEYRQMREEILKDMPWLRGRDEILLRKTYDEEGNEYYWNASRATHSQMERVINKRFNTRTSQQYEWWKSKNKDMYPIDWENVSYSEKLTDDIEQNAIEHFGTTDDFRVAGYIVPNGEMLDFSGAHWLDRDFYSAEEIAEWKRKNDLRQADHEDIAEAYPDGAQGDTRYNFMKRGNVRISPEAPGINLAKSKKPTAAQYATIKSFIRDWVNEKFDVLHVDLEGDNHDVDKVTYRGKISADKVVNDLKDYYETGNVPKGSEGSLSEFYSVKEDGKTLGFTEDHLDRFMSSSYEGTGNDKSYGYLAYLTPEQFIKLTTTNEASVEMVKDWKTGDSYSGEDFNMDKFKETSLRSPIKLDYDPLDGRVVGHEGRHRMWQLHLKGIENVPVFIKIYPRSTAVRDITRIRLLGQEFGNRKNDYVAFIDKAIPLSQQYRDDLLNEFGAGDEVFSAKEDKRDFMIDLYETRVNKDAPYDWNGMSNLASASMMTNSDIKNMVGKVINKGSDKQVTYIGRTIDAIDTDMDWSWLTISFRKDLYSGGDRCKGLYFDGDWTLKVNPDSPNSLAHEMGHALDNRWAFDIFGVEHTPLTKMGQAYSNWSDDKKAWYKHFKRFIASIVSVADRSNKYLKEHNEIFARFVETFVPWVENVATGDTLLFDGDANYADDRFTEEHFIDFIHLLQEKAALDASEETSYSWKDEEGELHLDFDDVLSLEDFERYVEKVVGKLTRKEEYLRKINTEMKDKILLNNRKLNEFAADIKKRYDLSADQKTIVSKLREAYGDDEAMLEVAKELVGTGEHVTVVEGLKREAEQLKKELKTYTFSLSDDQKKELKYHYGSNWASVFLGKINWRTNGTPLDNLWETLKNEYPALFEDVSTADEGVKLAEVLDLIYSGAYYERRSFDDSAAATRALFEDIRRGIFDVSDNLGMAEKYRQAGEELEAEYKEKIKDKRKALEGQTRALKEELKGEYKAKQAELQARYDEALKTLREEVKKAKRDVRESAIKDRLVTKILERANKIATKYNKNDSKEHIPDVLKEAVNGIFEMVDMTYDLPKGSLKNHLTALSNALQKAAPTEEDAIESLGDIFDTDGYFVEQVESIISEVDEKLNEFKANHRQGVALEDLSIESLSKLNEVLTAITTAARNYDTALASENRARISERGESSMNFLRDKVPMTVQGGVKKLVTNFLTWDNITPVYGYDRFGEGGKETFKAFMEADDRSTQNSMAIIDYCKGVFTGEEAEEWANQINTVNIGGKEYPMTTAQIMSLYCLYKRDSAHQHLFKAKNAYGNEIDGKGIVIGEIKKTSTETGEIRITEKEIQSIISELTDRQKEVADKLQQFMATTCADWGNYVTMKRFGIMQFGEKDYFPMTVYGQKRNVTAQEDNKQASLFKLLNMGFTKSLDPKSNSALIVSSIFDVFIKHSSEMAAYNAYALPVLDAIKWLNYSEKTKDNILPFKEVIKQVYGTAGKSFIVDHIRDINGQANETDSSEALFKKIVRNYKTAATAANLRVVAMQPTAYLRAFNEIDGKYLRRAISLNPFAIKEAVKEMNEKSILAQRKNDLGAFDANLARTVEEQALQVEDQGGVKAAVEKGMNASLWLAKKADEITWGTLYKAVQLEVKDKTNLTGAEFDNEVNERFRDVCYRTQVFDSINARSRLMRSKRPFQQMLTAFMAEPTLSYSMLSNEVFMYNVDARDGHKNQSWAKHGQKIKRAFVSYLMTALAVSAVAAVPDWLRDDDDEKPFYETYFKNFGMNLLAEATGLLPYIRDAYSVLVEGYNPSRPDEEIMTSARKEYLAIVNAVENGKVTWRVIYQTAKLFSQATGIPVGNVIRDVRALWNKSVGEIFDMKIK